MSLRAWIAHCPLLLPGETLAGLAVRAVVLLGGVTAAATVVAMIISAGVTP